MIHKMQGKDLENNVANLTVQLISGSDQNP